MAADPVVKADKLASKAVKGFNRAHATLQQANDLLDGHAEAQRLAAIAWRKQVEESIRAAEEAQRNAEVLRAKNQKKIAILSDLIA